MRVTKTCNSPHLGIEEKPFFLHRLASKGRRAQGKPRSSEQPPVKWPPVNTSYTNNPSVVWFWLWRLRPMAINRPVASGPPDNENKTLVAVKVEAGSCQNQLDGRGPNWQPWCPLILWLPLYPLAPARSLAEKLLLSNNVNDYHFVSQGKTSIPGLDDGEEFLVTDVSPSYSYPIPTSCSSLIMCLCHPFLLVSIACPSGFLCFCVKC